MTLEEFFEKLQRVDFLYSMSDDHRAWQRGKDQVAAVNQEAESLGDEYVKMFNDFRDYKSSLVTGEAVKKPELEDYTGEHTHG